MNESLARTQIVEFGKSLFDRQLTGGSTGNISSRVGDRILMTPTGSIMGSLDGDRLSVFDSSGNHVDGDRPTKESVLHVAVYNARPDANAIVHLHSPYSVAVSCLEGIDPENMLPPITAYYVMRVGKLPVVPFYPPGDEGLAAAVGKKARDHHAIMLAHHGPVVAGKDLPTAVDSIEELEQTAKLYLLLEGRQFRTLTPDDISRL